LYTRLIFPSRFSEQNRDARMQAFECLEELVHSCGFASRCVSLQVGRYIYIQLSPAANAFRGDQREQRVRIVLL